MRNVPHHRDYTYRVTAPAAKSAVTLVTFKNHIKRKPTNTSEDGLLNVYLQAAIEYAESITRKDLITKTYLTFRDYFPSRFTHEGYYNLGIIPETFNINSVTENVGFEIRRSPLQSVVSLQYFVDNVLTVLDPSRYYNTLEEDYSSVLSTGEWPNNADDRLQSIQITFTCGISDDPIAIPAGYKNAILIHATALWQNRGDCSSSTSDKVVPPPAKAFYMQNRIENL